MIKSKVEKDNKIHYPCLLIDEYDQVVLFTQESEGLLLDKGSNNIGDSIHFSIRWEMDRFKPFTGKITLKNIL